MRIAVIDLGTNTFNLLVAESGRGRHIEVLYRNEIGVKIGQGGINRKIITEGAFQRGMAAVTRQMETARQYHPDKIVVVATSGIRSADNGSAFIEKVHQDLNVPVEVVSGHQEAGLIYRGVRQSVNLGEQPALIIDIGGGSNECIIASEHHILWKQSFDIGMARVLEKFQPSDPITQAEIEKIRDYYHHGLADLRWAYHQYQPGMFVGCAGTFESIRSVLSAEGLLDHDLADQPCIKIPHRHFLQLHHKLIRSTSEERQNIKGLELFRVDMIVLASIFVNFIMEKFGFEQFVQSSYAIKEGVADRDLNGE